MKTFRISLAGLVILALLLVSCQSEVVVIEEEVETESATEEVEIESATEEVELPLEGISIHVADETSQEEPTFRISEVDPPDGAVTSAISPVYSIEFESQVDSAVDIRIRIPETSAGEVAHPYIIHWNGEDWDYIEAYVDDGWLVASVTSFSNYAVGYATGILLERNDGTLEFGTLQVEKVDGEEFVVLYNSQGDPIDSNNIIDYRGGVTYHSDKVNGFVLAVDMLTHLGLPLASFQEALDVYVVNSMEELYNTTAENIAGVTLFEPNSWSSTCRLTDGYDLESNLTLTYRLGRTTYPTGYGPWLYLEIERAENIVGDRVVFVLYSGSNEIIAFEMTARDLQIQSAYRIELPLLNNQVPITNMKLVGLVMGAPNIPWWEFWENSDERILCSYGDVVSSQTTTSPAPELPQPSPSQSSVEVHLARDTSVSINEFQSMSVYFGWAASTSSQVQDYIDSMSVTITLAGSTYHLGRENFGPIEMRSSCEQDGVILNPCWGSTARMELAGLPAGTYQMSTVWSLSRTVEDGWGTYGPGVVYQHSVTVQVE